MSVHDPVHSDRASHEVVVSIPRLVGIWVALLALTGLTVGATYFEFGALEVFVALAIAGVKAALVASEYMHLRHDRPVVLAFIAGAMLFLVLFVGLVLLDVGVNSGLGGIGSR